MRNFVDIQMKRISSQSNQPRIRQITQQKFTYGVKQAPCNGMKFKEGVEFIVKLFNVESVAKKSHNIVIP